MSDAGLPGEAPEGGAEVAATKAIDELKQELEEVEQEIETARHEYEAEHEKRPTFIEGAEDED